MVRKLISYSPIALSQTDLDSVGDLQHLSVHLSDRANLHEMADKSDNNNGSKYELPHLEDQLPGRHGLFQQQNGQETIQCSHEKEAVSN